MAKSKNIGVCLLCKQNVEHRIITKHVEKCLEQNVLNSTAEKNEQGKVFLIKIFAGKEFWIYIEINGSSTLNDLDDFLREIWLECCGHLSQFIINRSDYANDSKKAKTILDTLPVGTEFLYEYDFGDTTELAGLVISVRSGKLQEKIRLIARNNLPENIQCMSCKKTPIVICSCCYDFYCKKCKKDHKNCDGEEYMLPVVNSPRMGVCGYTGPDDE